VPNTPALEDAYLGVAVSNILALRDAYSGVAVPRTQR
jgi:hypothetical protein